MCAVSVYICACIHVCVCVCELCLRACVCEEFVRAYLHVSMRVYRCVKCAHMFMMHVCACRHVWVCVCICVYVCVYVSTRAGRFCNFSARYIV